MVFPILIPTLTSTPITAFNARALASLVTVAGNALSKRLNTILGALVPAIESERDSELLHDMNDAIKALLASISDAEGLNTLMLLLLGWSVVKVFLCSLMPDIHIQGERSHACSSNIRYAFVCHLLRRDGYGHFLLSG